MSLGTRSGLSRSWTALETPLANQPPDQQDHQESHQLRDEVADGRPPAPSPSISGFEAWFPLIYAYRMYAL